MLLKAIQMQVIGGGEPAHLGLAFSSVRSGLIGREKSLDLQRREEAASWRPPQFGCWGRQAAESSPGDPERCFDSTGQAAVLNQLPEPLLCIRCRQIGSQLVTPLGLI